jgi:alcohol dehydrogenase (cytochrome c)
MATGGGIVFGGNVDRQFFALDANNGKLLWQSRLNGDISGGPISFAIDGRQYIAVTAGGRPGNTTSFAPLTNTYLTSGSGVVWVFALPDQHDLDVSPRAGLAPIINTSTAVQSVAKPAPAPSSTTTASSRPGIFTSAQAARGMQVFNQFCISCHALKDQSGASFIKKWGQGTVAPLFSFVSTAMPENAPGSLSKSDYAAVVAYLLNESGFAAGTTELPSGPEALKGIKLHR